MAVSILKCPYCSDSIRKSGAYIVGIAAVRFSVLFGTVAVYPMGKNADRAKNDSQLSTAVSASFPMEINNLKFGDSNYF